MKRIILLLTGILFLFTVSVTAPIFAQGDPAWSQEQSYGQGSRNSHHYVKKHKKHHKKHRKHHRHHTHQTANPDRAYSY